MIVGDVTFGLGANTKGLDQSLDRLRAFGRTVDQVAAQQVGASQAVVRAYNAQEKAMRGAVKQAAEMQRAIKSSTAAPQQQATMLAQVTNSLNGFTRSMASGQLGAVQFTRTSDRFGASMGKLSQQLKGFPAPSQQVNKFNTVLAALESSAVLAAGPLSGIGSRIRALGSIFDKSTLAITGFVAGAAAVAVGMAKLGSGAIRASMEVARIQAAFSVTSGSMVAARKEFDYTVNVSNRLGLELQSSANAYAQLTAASRGTRLEGQATRDIFESAAMASTALRLSTDDTTGVIKAFTQMISKGKIQAEELRGQLGDRLPGANRLMADALGITTQKLDSMMKKGELLSDEALPKLAKQMALVFGGPAAMQAAGLQASINRLSNEQLLFNKAFDDAVGVSTKYQAAIDALTGTIKFFRENIGTMVEVLVVAAGALGGFGAAMAVAFTMSKWTAIAGALANVTKLTWLFNVALLANPAVLIALAAALIGAGAAYLIYANKVKKANDVQTASTIANTKEFLESQRKMVSASKQTIDAYIDDSAKYLMAARLRISALDDEVRALEKQQKAYAGTILAPSNSRVQNAQDEYNKEGQRIYTLQQQLKALNKVRENAKDPADIPRDPGTPKAPKLDKMQEAIDDLEIIKQRNKDLESLPDYWLQGSEALDKFNKGLDNGKKLEAYHDKLVLAGASQQVLNQKMAEMSEALEASDAAEVRLKAIQDRAKALEQFGGDSLDAFGTFLDNLSDDTKTVSESFDDMVLSIIGSLRKLVIQETILKPLKEALFGGSSGGGNSGSGLFGSILGAIGSSVGGFFGSGGGNTGTTVASPSIKGASYMLPGRAAGGPVQRGKAYLVGEKGPEPFIPSSNGRIIPNDAMGGGGNMSITIINNSKSSISAKKGSNGRNLEVVIDDMVAKQLSNPSSRTARAAKNSQPILAGR